jgi:hypothetical protein
MHLGLYVCDALLSTEHILSVTWRKHYSLNSLRQRQQSTLVYVHLDRCRVFDNGSCAHYIDLCTIGCRNLYYEGNIILDDKSMFACSRILPGSVLSIELCGV